MIVWEARLKILQKMCERYAEEKQQCLKTFFRHKINDFETPIMFLWSSVPLALECAEPVCAAIRACNLFKIHYNIFTGLFNFSPQLKESPMKCLNCGRDGVFHQNARDVSESGGCIINCCECGQPHSNSLVFEPDTLSLPMTFWQKTYIFAGLILVIAVAYGLREAVTILLGV